MQVSQNYDFIKTGQRINCTGRAEEGRRSPGFNEKWTRVASLFRALNIANKALDTSAQNLFRILFGTFPFLSLSSS